MNRLQTIDADTLQSTAYEPVSFVVDDLLPQGLHLLAGAPKIGKSWLALWLCLCAAQGKPLWTFATRPCEVLYLCLEDSFQRIQSRLFDLTEDAPPTLHFAVMSQQLHNGLVEQIEQFLKEHPQTRLIVIDTLQRIRTVGNDANPYASDYRDIGVLKALADKHRIAILLVHHLRKMNDDDPMNMISGTTGLSGATDSNFVLRKSKRRENTATLYCIVPGAEEYILESFKWLGIHFDEGVSFGGECGPYRQSERREIYKKYVQVLLENGKAYIAFDTPEELDAKRAEIANFQYDASTRGMMRNSLTMPKEEVDALIAEGKQYVVRFKIEPNEDVHVNDLIRGEVIINSSILDDKVLYKSADELPTYHLANIVDDHLMGVSHVIRGEEWLPSAPLHVLLYRAFGWEDTMPEFAHLPLLLKPEGNGKLSKRDGDRLGFPVFPLEWHDPKSGEISSGYRESGYLPEAVINFLALLGWNPGNDQEVMSMDELIKLFDLHRCSKSGAKFDYKKGIWFNHQYIQQKPNEEIAELFLPFLKEHGVEAPFEKVVTVVGMMKDRVSFIKELWDVCSFFFVAPTEYDEKTVKKRWKEDSAKCMTELAEVIAGIEDFSIEGQEKVVMDWIAEKGYHTGNIMNAFRLTLVGEGKGPHMFDISWVLGKEETIARMKRAVEVLK